MSGINEKLNIRRRFPNPALGPASISLRHATTASIDIRGPVLSHPQPRQPARRGFSRGSRLFGIHRANAARAATRGIAYPRGVPDAKSRTSDRPPIGPRRHRTMDAMVVHHSRAALSRKVWDHGAPLAGTLQVFPDPG